MRYQEFITKLTETLKTQLDKDYQVKQGKIWKCNEGYQESILIAQADEAVFRGFPLVSLYEKFRSGNTIEDIATVIRCIIKTGGSCDLAAIRLYKDDFSAVKDRIIFHVIHAEKNHKFLQEYAHIRFLDLAVVFSFYGGKNGENYIYSPISENYRKRYGLELQELYSLALENAQSLLPGKATLLSNVLEDYGLQRVVSMSAFPMYVLTNQNNWHGAACILYPGILKKLSEQMNSDLLILPSSIHETLVIPDLERDISDIEEMVRSINQEIVPDEEVLSNRVYRFCRGSGSIVFAASDGYCDKQDEKQE